MVHEFIVGGPDSDVVNTDDANLPGSFTGHFDVASRLWKYPALSTHKPKEMQDPHIVNCTQEHNDYISSHKLDHASGLYSGYILKPSPLDATGQLKSCNCGNTYREVGTHVGKGTVYIAWDLFKLSTMTPFVKWEHARYLTPRQQRKRNISEDHTHWSRG